MNTKTPTRVDEVFDLLRSSAEAVLAQYGVSTSKSSKGWLNVSTCPWCQHGPDNYQCGVLESPGDRGYIHAVRCMHPHDSPSGEASPHYADFLVALGALSQDDVDLIHAARAPKPLKNCTVLTVKIVNTNSTVKPVALPRGELTVMNEENNAKTRRRLRDHVEATQYLQETRGLTPRTVERFKLGLSGPYEKDGVLVHSQALAAPLSGFDGRFYRKYVNYAIPGVTVDKREKPQRAWSPGAARAYYNGDARGKPILFVCDGLKDVWALSQLLEGSDLDTDIAFVSSTNGGQGVPDEWKNPDFWLQWDKVFLGHDNDREDPLTGRRAGDEHAKALAKLAERETLRAYPIGVKDWNDWTLAGATQADFRRVLEEAEPIQLFEDIKNPTEDDGVSKGEYSYDPVAIVGAFNKGFLYEAVRTIVRDIDPETGELVERAETRVIRSDRTTHRVRTMPAPKGTLEQNLIRRLYPDGTLVTGYPEPNPNLTWSWDSIQSWLNHKDKASPLGELVVRIENHLRGSVWLPNSDDYSILTCAVVVSYVQQVFDAVPILLLTGPAGTGKSELGMAMKNMGANSKNVLGVVTAATLARFIDATRGLVVIDDLEDIATGKDSAFGDIVQTLKLSYKKSTAYKLVTEIKNGKATQRQFNFFGVKVISNTRGTDEILGTRMFIVRTRQMPRGVQIQKGLCLSAEELDALRNNLHCWAFSEVGTVNESYQAIFPNKTSRQEEISAPLRVIAALSGSEALRASLEKALERHAKTKKDPDSPDELLKEALENIVRRSVEQAGQVPTWITVMQVMLELRTLADENYGKEFTTSLASIEKPEWVGAKLRDGFIEEGDAYSKRTNMYGKSLRAYQFTDTFLVATLSKLFPDAPEMPMHLPQSDNFKAFCRGCSACPYRNKCDMQAEREKSDLKKSKNN